MKTNHNFLSAISLFTLGLIVISCQNQTVDLSTFQIHPDFTIELAASEPLVFDPVEMEFDETGKAYVIEMPSYPDATAQNRIIILYDKNEDGIFDSRKIFAENLGVATSILPYKGGLLVAAPPELLFIKDTDGDDLADVREVLMSGFSYGNTQHNFNGLAYGLDNWIYGANGGNSGRPYWSNDQENKISLGRNDFRIDLSNKKLEPIGNSSGGFGLAFDNWGNMFETHNLEHISHLAFNERYLDKIPQLGLNARSSISDHDVDGLARIYPIGAQDTRVNHPEQSGFFSGACGITFYGGGAWPSPFDGNVFVADVVLNLIHRDVISANGSSLTASRGRESAAFLASKDRSFRPVNMTVGPDGALYIMDMYREVIEHPEWIPDEIEAALDLNAGKDKGRIYRITPKGFSGHKSSIIDRSNVSELVKLLEHPSQWHRLTAQRLLVETQDKAAIPLLIDLVSNSTVPLSRMHAMYTLQGLSALGDELLISALNDVDSEVRRHAIILSENSSNNPEIQKAILQAGSDSDIRVRRQVALTLSMIGLLDETFQANKSKVLLQIIKQDVDDRWSRLAALSASTKQPTKFLMALLDRNLSNSNELISQLSTLVAVYDHTAIPQSIGRASKIPDNNIVNNVLTGLIVGFDYQDTELNKPEKSAISRQLDLIENRGNIPVITSSWRLRKTLSLEQPVNRQAVLDRALLILKQKAKANGDRLDALGLLTDEMFVGKTDTFLQLLDPKEPFSIQIAAIEAICRLDESDISEKLISMWPGLSPAVRLKVSDFLIYNFRNQPILLTAIENGQLNLGELNLHLERRRELLFSKDMSIRTRAENLFSDAGIVTRKAAIESFKPALELKGRKAEGGTIFVALCAQCHQKSGTGIEVGPNLSEIYRKSAEALLNDIIDPNAGSDAEYINHVIKTEDGTVYTGIIQSETDANVTILNIGGTSKTIPRSEIASFESSGQSLMPEGLESSLDSQKMADLLAYLQSME
ncbi:MAG: hypothetical protein COA50_07810 [Flavobacteriaceae bacterium]|nr:MAG: hypothetical protein COA50_07810 [Flavobacteriaceae bacterium]